MKLSWTLLLSFFLATQAIAKEVSIIGVGDIMLGSNFPSASYLPPNNGKELMQSVYPILQDADVTFGNLEGSILDSGATIKNCKSSNACYAFRMPEKIANNLVDAGFDVMSIANNHIRDFGNTGLKNTQKVLNELGLHYAGLTSKPSTIFTKDGITYGFAAFAPNVGTQNINDIPMAKKIISNLAKKTDIIIVSFHGGAEGSKYQHVTRKTEKYYGENRGNVYQFAHAVIDAGADVVFGHGPHVTRAVEVYKNRFIAYSLGNFCTYGRFNLRGVNGVAPIIKVNMTETGEFINAKVTPIKQIGRGVVKIDKTKRAIQLLRQLTKADFPKSTVTIDSNGLLTAQ
ncbi:CapA family protein [Candidatus Albibeggiatoa sp. nov. NOAA]|uniref:CapA family protein n=1 Tax=Candidatus Albibeggiatoa sp. nov. NOAA TaxID=3162724 RepID=UPI0032F5766C|nr:CapA family protein [Thiotrichaceae bacterium]